MPPMIEFPLDLREVCVLKTELKKREIAITVESTRPYAICSRCGQKTFEFHSYDDLSQSIAWFICNRTFTSPSRK